MATTSDTTPAAESRSVLVPASRVDRWLANFEARHGTIDSAAREGAWRVAAEDGAVAEIRLPFERPFAGSDPQALVTAAQAEVRWGLLVVRRGGFAVATGTTPTASLSKVGRRHVQGKTKAGGWSQQRFARRRDNQARAAYDAAADHAVRILVDEQSAPIQALVCGGDRRAVDTVLADKRLQHLSARRAEPWLAVGDPNAAVLRAAIADAWSCQVTVRDPE